MINYVIQVMLFQALFLMVYDLFLQKETFFKWNRFYLLVTPLLSYGLPLVKISGLTKVVSQEYIVQLPTVLLNPQSVIDKAAPSIIAFNYINFIFYAGIVVVLLLFIWRLYSIIKLVYKNKVIKKGNFKLVLLTNKQLAFSFFNYIFIHTTLVAKKDLKIIRHELVHVKELHSLDLLYFEIQKVVMWFNPLVYIFQKRITLLHEYISDAKAIKNSSKETYFNQLLAHTFRVENISFINQFFKHSLIKKRIVMITKDKSKKVKKFKYLLIVPLLVGMLVYTSCADDTKGYIEIIEQATKEQDNENLEIFEGSIGKIVLGDSYEGKVVPYEAMTEKEKKLFDELNRNKRAVDLPVQVIINKEGERVIFIKKISKGKTKLEAEFYEDGTVPFASVETVPVFPGCEGSNDVLKKCLQEKITEHVSTNFNANLANSLGLTPGIKRIFVMFKIDKDGYITEVKARAPHIKLQEEAIRVIKSLPKMIPGRQDGKAVGVNYSLPIAFKVE